MGNATGKKVFVGLSGGVDSSVSAALLKEAGYDVVGAFIRVWNPEWLECNWREERRDAMRVAARLGIPFMTIDLQEEYKKHVADYMIDEYKKGRTPNPDVMCNKEIKFGAFLKRAREMGADYIATGHYAQVISHDSKINLAESADKNKDQSYFLWTLTQDVLDHVLFPVGHLKKEEVRKLAKKFNLPTAEKKDSQGICFLGKVDMKEFLSHYITVQSGSVLDEKGETIGRHDGAVLYTIGERHGFEIFHKIPHDMPYYITSKDIQQNTITVSQKKSAENILQNVQEISLDSLNWISGILPDLKKIYSARIRYRQEKQECVIDARKGKGQIKVMFKEPQQGISAGQSLVMYDGETCLGGGIIELAN